MGGLKPQGLRLSSRWSGMKRSRPTTAGPASKVWFRRVRVEGRAGEAEVIVKNLFQPDHRLPYEEQKIAQAQMRGALKSFGLEPSEPLRKLGD